MHMTEVKAQILKWLQAGYSQSQIAEKLKEQNISTNSLSSVEKKLKEIRESYKAKTMFHLACILNDEGYFKR